MFNRRPVVNWYTEEEFIEYLPRPYKAVGYKPDWYKKMARKIKGLDEAPFKDSTIRQCPPFLDAMDAGYIIPLSQSVAITTNEDCSEVRWDYPANEYRTITVLESHSQNQVQGMWSQPAHPCKWLNYWVMVTPPGYSTLFVDPLNRPNGIFSCIAGVVDTDRYYEYINFPFIFTKPNMDAEIIPSGTPLVQAIPFKRENWRDMRDTFGIVGKELDLTRRKRSLYPSLYRDKLWHRRDK